MSILSIFKNGKKKLFVATIGNDYFPATPKAIKNMEEKMKPFLDKDDVLIVWNHTLNIKVLEK